RVRIRRVHREITESLLSADRATNRWLHHLVHTGARPRRHAAGRHRIAGFADAVGADVVLTGLRDGLRAGVAGVLCTNDFLADRITDRRHLIDASLRPFPRSCRAATRIHRADALDAVIAFRRQPLADDTLGM